MSEKKVNVDAIVDGGTLMVKAFNSGSNVLGSKKASSWVEFGSLIPEMLSFASRAGDIPEELSHLDNNTAAAIIDKLSEKLDLANDHAEKIAKSVLRLFSTLLSFGGDAVEGIIEAIKGPAEESGVGKSEGEAEGGKDGADATDEPASSEAPAPPPVDGTGPAPQGVDQSVPTDPTSTGVPKA